MSRLRSTIALTALLALSATAGAQGNRRTTVPPGQMPPAGMCRIWIDGVPAGRQPAPTDCATARAQAGANARVLYGGNVNGNVNAGTRVNRPWDVGANTTDSRSQRQIDKSERKRERELAKANRKRDKEWNKGRKHGDDDGDDGDDDDDRDGDRGGDRDHDRRDRGTRGGVGVNTCIDSNRDGRCDNASTSTGVLLPRILRP